MYIHLAKIIKDTDSYSIHTFACLIIQPQIRMQYVYISYYCTYHIIYLKHYWTIIHYVCSCHFVALNLNP